VQGTGLGFMSHSKDEAFESKQLVQGENKRASDGNGTRDPWTVRL